MSEIQDDGYLEGLKDFFARQMERQVERDRMIAEGRRAAMDQYTPSAGQLANFGGMLLPMAGTADASGEYPALPSGEQPFSEAFSGEPYPSMAENIERGGPGGYFDASMQGLGVGGDALWAMPIIGPIVGPTLGTALKATGAAGKIGKAVLTAQRAGKGSRADEIDQGIGALDTNVSAVIQPPIRTTPIFQEFGVGRVREVESALKQQQSDLLSVEDMVQRANTVNPSFQANIDLIASSVGGKKADKFITLKDGSKFDVEVKTPGSIATKVERKGLKPADFTDGVRTTIYIDTADQAEEAVDQIGNLYTTIDRGWQRIPESGYFDRKMNILVPDPASGKMIVGEIQIKTPQMHQAAEKGHRWYEISRKLEGRYNHKIPKEKLRTYNSALDEQNKLYKDALEAADPEILQQLIDKFRLGGAVGADPQFFRMSFQS